MTNKSYRLTGESMYKSRDPIEGCRGAYLFCLPAIFVVIEVYLCSFVPNDVIVGYENIERLD